MAASCEISTDGLVPEPWLANFEVEQPYRIALVGEKSSLEPVLGRIAGRYNTDLFLGTGDITNTMVDQIARAAADDPRPLRVLYFADCDPAGYNMSISVAHKLRARRDVAYPGLDFQVYRVALTPDQVREHDLPESPIKDTELRAGAWCEAMGVQQTEIDSIATLRPELLERIATDAVEGFHDTTLRLRVSDARGQWLADAQEVIAEAVDPEVMANATQRLDDLRVEAARFEERLNELIAEIQDSVEVDVDELPDLPELPNPQVSGVIPDGFTVCDSAWDFREHIERLRAQKRYES